MINGQTRDIKLEEKMDLDFIDEIRDVPGGDNIKGCIQCGTCSGACPASYMMDYTPRQLFAMIRAGMRNEVLSSDSIWLCSSCYMCVVRCPREIKITDIMYGLKRIAIKDKKYVKGMNAEVLARLFVKYINKYGRNPEMQLMQRYMLKTNPLGIIGYLPMGLKLFFRGRLPLIPKKIRGVDELKKIIEKVNSMEGI